MKRILLYFLIISTLSSPVTYGLNIFSDAEKKENQEDIDMHFYEELAWVATFYFFILFIQEDPHA